MLHKLGFDKENVYEELKAAVRFVSVIRGLRENVVPEKGVTKVFSLADARLSFASTGLSKVERRWNCKDVAIR